MAGPQSVSFINPIDPVGAQIAMEQAQRQQDLADALRAQSLKPVQVQSGPISWTQGLAQLAQAIAANHLNRKAQGTQYQAQAQAANANAIATTPKGQPVNLPYDPNNNPYTGDGQHRNFGQKIGDFVRGGPPLHALAAALQPQQPAAQPAPVSASIAPPQQGIAPSPQMTPPAAPQGTPQAPQAQPGDGQPLPMTPPAGTGQYVGSGALSLSGDPARDRYLQMSNPAEYNKALIAKSAPLAPELLIAHIKDAAERGDMATVQALSMQMQKDQYIAPATFRGGSYSQDPRTGQTQYHPQLPEGVNASMNPDGTVGSAAMIPGVVQGQEALAAAKARGAAQGELTDVVDPATGRTIQVPKSSVLGGAGGAPARGPGPLQGAFGGGAAGGGAIHALGPGEQAALGVTGTNSANAYQALSDQAAGVPDQIYAARQLQKIVADPNTVVGPGSAKLATVAGAMNTFAQSIGVKAQLSPQMVTNGQEVSKWASQLAARSAATLGLSGSDKRVEIALHASPNGTMTKDALQSVADQVVGLSMAVQGRAAAAVHYQQSHGAQSFQQFSSEFNQNYDPRIYTWLAAEQSHPGTIKRNFSALPPQERAQLVQRSNRLAALGALTR